MKERACPIGEDPAECTLRQNCHYWEWHLQECKYSELQRAKKSNVADELKNKFRVS